MPGRRRLPPPATGHASLARTSDLWWKDAVVYCVDVKTFMDGNGDGIGDFRGLTQRIDHLTRLGVDCIWLMPFYPSPERDDGYDVSDFYGVDPRLGTLGDFVDFVRTATDRGLRVIVDAVVNHTSNKHPWFLEARSDRDSPYRDFYVWTDDPAKEERDDLVFPGDETSVWQWDDRAGQYYLHRFYRYQPDLNVTNETVRNELARTLGFWLELGVSGFRVDAVPFFLETIGVESRAPAQPHEYVRDLRAFLTRRRGDAILLGEVNVPLDSIRDFFGDEDGDELHACFSFVVNQALFLSLVRGDARPLRKALESLPAIPYEGQWANFVRNHDELSLDKLSDAEREEVFDQLAPDEEMRIYGRGIRRRLAPMLGGDRRRIELAYSVLFTLPGTPVLLYGEEIGMGENLELDDRLAVRVPMQWSSDANGGFSTADRRRLWAPAREDGEYGYARVNVADQWRDRGSLLEWMTGMIRAYKDSPELGWGESRVLDAGADSVLAVRCEWHDRCSLTLHNLSDEPAVARLAANDVGRAELQDAFGGERLPAADGLELELEPYGYRWLRGRG
jgi:trehalose synthase